jgi:hypothetical protein
MKKTLVITCVAFCIAAGFAFYSPKCDNSSAGVELKTAMNKLWEDHITWTRNVICCLVDGLPGADQAVSRLLKNQEDIGNAIKPYYGNEAGDKLTSLLKPHITISAEVVKAAKANNKMHWTKRIKSGSIMRIRLLSSSARQIPTGNKKR